MSDRKHFNDEQWSALTTIEGPALVLAGAGSGKTRVVTSRIAYLIEQGVSPSEILGVTFTNKAAEEMRQRVLKLTQHLVFISTFHSLGVKILRESIHLLGYSSHFTIYDEEDVEKLLKKCLEDLGVKSEGKKNSVKPYRQLISSCKNALLHPEEVDLSMQTSDFAKAFPLVCRLYQKKLKEYQAVDFDDLLVLPVKIWTERPDVLSFYQNRWRFLLVDEFQDTNEAQYAMVRLLTEKSHNLFVVGDPDQSIYSWRGANIQNILHFEQDHPNVKIIRLEQNYRSCSTILNAANALIQNNRGRYEKKLWSNRGEGDKIELYQGFEEDSEALFVALKIQAHRKNGIPLNEIAIFFRTNAQSRALEDSLLTHSIPYKIVGGISFYQRREIKDVLAFLRVSLSAGDFMAFARTLPIPQKGIGETTIEKLRVTAAEKAVSIITLCKTLVEGKEAVSPLRLSSKQKGAMAHYLSIIEELHQMAQQKTVHEIVLAAIQKSGYLDYLKEDKESYKERSENLNALVAKAMEWEKSAPNPTLEAFLEELSLKSSADETSTDQGRVSLMTLHHGKGLEFRSVFIVGLEEDILPHINSKDSLAEIEEERRLFYVGMTRAKEHLCIAHCQMRFLWGVQRFQKPSRFLKEIPNIYTVKGSIKR